MEHSFDTEVANKYSVLEAIIIRQFQSWPNIKVSMDMLRKTFHYLTELRLDETLQRLEDKSVLIVDNDYSLAEEWHGTQIPKPKKRAINDEFCKRVMDCFCTVTGSEADLTPSRQRLINSRLKEIKEGKDKYLSFESVIKLKHKQWKDDPKMKPYIRPSTLFGAEKFHEYLDEARKEYKKAVPKGEKMENPYIKQGLVKDYD
jgi:uncharacterized phage protein (TIGR02220 family)